MRDTQIIHWSVNLVVISSFTGTSYGARGGGEGPASIALVILFISRHTVHDDAENHIRSCEPTAPLSQRKNWGTRHGNPWQVASKSRVKVHGFYLADLFMTNSHDSMLQQSLLTCLWMYQHAEGGRALQVHHERHEFCSRNMFIKIWTKQSSARHFPMWYRHLPHHSPTFTPTSSHRRGRGWYMSLIIKIYVCSEI